MSAAPRLIHCRVRVVMAGLTLEFDGLYPSTCDAIIDGQTRAGDRGCRVTARAIV